MPRLSKIGAAALAAFGWTTGGGATVVTASYLQVAGGGGGGQGGGGAGGYLTGTTSLTTTLSYTVVVGAGGTLGSGNGSIKAGNGGNSQFGTLTASVGGGGGGPTASNSNGASGGSGGGGAQIYGGASSSGGSGTSGQGNAGGGNGGFGAFPIPGGGGGGAGAVGGTATSDSQAGNGGNGLSSSISGTATYYAGGGGGGLNTAGAGVGTGGLGGGGTGNSAGSAANPGTANTGGGGGGTGSGAGGQGGSGIVIISYAGAQQFGGGIVTSVGGNTIHTFLTSGTLSPLSSLTASYLIVAGGGGSNALAGGGGAGGLLSGSGVTIDTNSTYLVTVGAGGPPVTNGSNSSFSMVSTTALGGGYGNAGNGNSGGSGGGGGWNTAPGNGGAGTSGQGNAGGGGTAAPNYAGGGGGGAGAAGGNASGTVAGNGGVGVTSSISGTSTYYAGGGGGGGNVGGTAGSGGLGGGGAGYAGNDIPARGGTNGTANTGGGGGGGGNGTGGGTYASGGSGIVIISYAGSTQQMAGGSVTITGGNVIHTFTSSGYLTPLTYFNNSLRWRASASSYLSRTPKVASNRQVWTWSAWIKRGSLSGGSVQQIFAATASSPTNDTDLTGIAFDGNDCLTFGGGATTFLTTTQVFRDPAAWYHIVIAFDSTQATTSNRIKLYVNGVQVTAFSTANYVTQNLSVAINSTVQHLISSLLPVLTRYFDGYQTEVRLIDGQALTANSFGAFNSYGVWQPINYGGSYGTNGFYLPFPAGTTSSYASSTNGSSQYLTVGSAANWKFLNDGSTFTAEAWIYPQSIATDQTILCTDASSAGTGIFFGVSDVSSGDLVASIYKSVGGVNFTVSSAGGLIQTNKWYHVVATLTSTAFILYLNGQQVGYTAIGSFTFNNANPSQTLQIGRYISSAGAGGGYFTGYISNVRLTNTNVYTGSFTPSTSPLTAVTGTQLLTLQNSTLIDNSTNAYTITNNGSVNMSVQYPFSVFTYADQSPQGNNWAPNNFSQIVSSSYDSMTDVPTLTSATAANYCVLNPLISSTTVTFTNGNLALVSGSANWGSGFGTMALPTTGKYYWEVTAGAVNNLIGIASIASNLNADASSYFTNTTTSYAYLSSTGNKNSGPGNTSAAYGATYSTGDIIGVAFDADAGTLTFYKNNVSQGTAYTGLTAQYIPAVGVNNTTLYCNFGQQPFKYTPPSGYVALNTYNL